MNYCTELLRIADTVKDEKDAEILRIAAVKLAPMPEPSIETVEEIPGWGIVHNKVWS